PRGMGSDTRILIHRTDAETAAALQRMGFTTTVDGEWLRLDPKDDGSTDDEALAARLSESLGATTVFFAIQTTVDQVEIRCCESGRVVRSLGYAAEQGWFTNSGKARPFEAKAALGKRLRKRSISASPDGYDVLDCFLGRSVPPPERVKEPNATQ